MEENDNNLNNTNIEPVSENMTTPETNTNVAVEPAVMPAAPESVSQPSVEPVPVATNDVAPKKGNGPIILLVLLLLIGAGVAAYFCFFTGDKNVDKKKGTVENEEKQSPYRLNGNGLENFDLQFLKIESNNQNIVYSPLSIKYTLAMINEGTDGESNAQIKALIGDYKSTKYVNSKNLSLANAMFVRNDFKDEVKASYSEAINSKYGAEVIYDDFTSATNINNWVKDKTLGLITNGLESAPTDKLFYLVNALAIDMEWKNKFDTKFAWYEHTNFGWETFQPVRNGKFSGMDEEIATMEVKASFNRSDIIKDKGGEEAFRKEIEKYYIDCYNENKTDLEITQEINAEYVKKDVDEAYNAIKGNYNRSDFNTDFYFYLDKDVTVFAKDLKEYDGTTLQYVGFMPVSDSLANFIKNVDAKKLQRYMDNLKYTEISNFEDGYLTYIYGTIPKFNYDYKLNLKNDLNNLGIVDVFDGQKANLSKLADGPVFIDEVLHKATIEMNQDGIKAGAVTLAGGLGNLMICNYKVELPTTKIDITFDKPYMYLVRNKATGEVWFAGSVYNPTTWAYEQEHKAN